jgi:RNA polymerase sigma-54 factor
MKQTIQLRLGQQLTMTPQLQQAIKLLQLSTLDLQREIQDALESNLMLESTEEVDAGVDASDAEARRTEAEAKVDNEVRPEQSEMPDELPLDSSWAIPMTAICPLPPAAGRRRKGSRTSTRSRSTPARKRCMTTYSGNSTSNAWRRVTGPSPRRCSTPSTRTATCGSDIDELVSAIEGPVTNQDRDAPLEADEVEAVLHRIQSLDPPGVGARSLAECLLLQLRQLPADEPFRDEAVLICSEQFSALSRNDLDQLRRGTKLPPETLREALGLIRSLNPRPGALVSELRPEYVIPDVLVHKRAASGPSS